MQVVTLKTAPAKRMRLAHRVAIFIKQRRVDYLRSEAKVEAAELERCQARILALDAQIIREANELSSLKLK